MRDVWRSTWTRESDGAHVLRSPDGHELGWIVRVAPFGGRGWQATLPGTPEKWDTRHRSLGAAKARIEEAWGVRGGVVKAAPPHQGRLL